MHPYFFPLLQEGYALCISLSRSVTYDSEMIVCHPIYQSVINQIRKRTVVFLWERVVYDKRSFRILDVDKYLYVKLQLYALSNTFKALQAPQNKSIKIQ